MPAHKKPSNVLELTGRMKHDGKRNAGRPDPGDQSTVEPLGSPPPLTFITFEDAWNEVVGMAAPGVLTKRDRAMVEQTARLHQQLRNRAVLVEMEGKFWLDAHTPTVKLYQSFLAKLGLSPVDCVNVNPVVPKKPSNGW